MQNLNTNKFTEIQDTFTKWQSKDKSQFLFIEKVNQKESLVVLKKVTFCGKLWMKIQSFFGCGSLKRVMEFIVNNKTDFKQLVRDNQEVKFEDLKSRITHYIEHHKFWVGKIGDQVLKILTKEKEIEIPLKVVPKTELDIAVVQNTNAPPAQNTNLEPTQNAPPAQNTGLEPVQNTNAPPVQNTDKEQVKNTDKDPSAQTDKPDALTATNEKPVTIQDKTVVGTKGVQSLQDTLFCAAHFALSKEEFASAEKIDQTFVILKDFRRQASFKMTHKEQPNSRGSSQYILGYFANKGAKLLKQKNSKWSNFKKNDLVKSFINDFCTEENSTSAFMCVNEHAIGLRKKNTTIELFDPKGNKSTKSCAFLKSFANPDEVIDYLQKSKYSNPKSNNNLNYWMEKLKDANKKPEEVRAAAEKKVAKFNALYKAQCFIFMF